MFTTKQVLLLAILCPAAALWANPRGRRVGSAPAIRRVARVSMGRTQVAGIAVDSSVTMASATASSDKKEQVQHSATSKSIEILSDAKVNALLGTTTGSGGSEDSSDTGSGEASFLKRGAYGAANILRSMAPGLMVTAGSCLSSHLYQSSGAEGPQTPAFLIPLIVSVLASCAAEGVLSEDSTLGTIAGNVLPRLLLAAPAGVALNHVSGASSAISKAWGLVTDPAQRTEAINGVADTAMEGGIRALARRIKGNKDGTQSEAIKELVAAITGDSTFKTEMMQAGTDMLHRAAADAIPAILHDPATKQGIQSAFLKPIGEGLCTQAAAINPGIHLGKHIMKGLGMFFGKALVRNSGALAA